MTIDEITALTDDELRMKVAEALGKHQYYGVLRAGMRCTTCGDDIGEDKHRIPNYPADLNACAQFEQTMGEDECETYIDYLAECSGCDSGFFAPAIFATARQRCIAFLATKS